MGGTKMPTRSLTVRYGRWARCRDTPNTASAVLLDEPGTTGPGDAGVGGDRDRFVKLEQMRRWRTAWPTFAGAGRRSLPAVDLSRSRHRIGDPLHRDRRRGVGRIAGGSRALLSRERAGVAPRAVSPRRSDKGRATQPVQCRRSRRSLRLRLRRHAASARASTATGVCAVRPRVWSAHRPSSDDVRNPVGSTEYAYRKFVPLQCQPLVRQLTCGFQRPHRQQRCEFVTAGGTGLGHGAVQVTSTGARKGSAARLPHGWTSCHGSTLRSAPRGQRQPVGHAEQRRRGSATALAGQDVCPRRAPKADPRRPCPQRPSLPAQRRAAHDRRSLELDAAANPGPSPAAVPQRTVLRHRRAVLPRSAPTRQAGVTRSVTELDGGLQADHLRSELALDPCGLRRQHRRNRGGDQPRDGDPGRASASIQAPPAGVRPWSSAASEAAASSVELRIASAIVRDSW